jgi:hypothetical protein
MVFRPRFEPNTSRMQAQNTMDKQTSSVNYKDVLVIMHHAKKTLYEYGNRGNFHTWTSALAVNEQSDSRSGRFIPEESVPGTHWIGCWVDLEPIWMSMKKLSLLLSDIWPQSSNPWPVSLLTKLHQFLLCIYLLQRNTARAGNKPTEAAGEYLQSATQWRLQLT